jgi:hypothetical protein
MPITLQQTDRHLSALSPEQRAQVERIAKNNPKAVERVLCDLKYKRLQVVKPVQGLDPAGTGYVCTVCGEPLPNSRNLTICRKCKSVTATFAGANTPTMRRGNQPLRRGRRSKAMRPLTSAIRSQKRDAKASHSSPLQP